MADSPTAGFPVTTALELRGLTVERDLERFRDPTTQAIMRVWIDPADQTRHYVPEGDD